MSWKRCEYDDDEIDRELMLEIACYDPTENYPEWSNASMRDAYRAGWEAGRNV